eukprot:UN06729
MIPHSCSFPNTVKSFIVYNEYYIAIGPHNRSLRIMVYDRKRRIFKTLVLSEEKAHR